MGSDEDGKNMSNIDHKCRFCGTANLVQDSDRGELVCNDCGLVDSLENLDIAGHVRLGEGSHNSVSSELGSFIGEGRGVSQGIKRASKMSHKKPSYLQRLFSIVDDVVPEGRMRQNVKELMRDFNEKEALLWRKRRKLRGGNGTLYRMRVIVAGALSALNSRMQHNGAKVIARRWGIEHKDLINSTTMFRRFILKGCTALDKELLRRQRRDELVFHLGRYRELLAERVGWEIATQVFEEAMEDLAKNMEPVQDEADDNSMSHIQSTKYGTKSSEGASWEAILVAMLGFGMGSEIIRWLESRAVPSSGGNVTKAYSKEANNIGLALADGVEEE
tara:strand:- start:4158 stop:5153 length:996 start_codon:yes stop_codon:yes gene_type:complete